MDRFDIGCDRPAMGETCLKAVFYCVSPVLNPHLYIKISILFHLENITRSFVSLYGKYVKQEGKRIMWHKWGERAVNHIC